MFWKFESIVVATAWDDTVERHGIANYQSIKKSLAPTNQPIGAHSYQTGKESASGTFYFYNVVDVCRRPFQFQLTHIHCRLSGTNDAGMREAGTKLSWPVSSLFFKDRGHLTRGT